ncbi:MAG TPA: ATP-binding protein [Acidobacteriota bacterium]|nr:ATP-binding protein [Acidobacteriota bacterium]
MKRSHVVFLVLLVAVLALGTLNVIHKAAWRDVTDGVTWKAVEGGLRAIRVDPTSEAFLRSGIKKGDILTAINNVPVRTKIEVLKSLWQAAATDQPVRYQINKEGMQIYPTFYPQRKAVNPIYYYLVLVGVTTLAIGLIVFFNSRGQMSLPYIFYYLLVLAFAAFMIFSPTGEMTSADLVFYGLDKIGFLAFPPLLLHFFMIFPLRKRFLRNRQGILPFLYAPAAFLLLARVRLHIPLPSQWGEAAVLRTQDGLERLELLHFAVFTLATLIILAHSTRRAPNILVKKQLRIIVGGLAFGILPSTALYVIPFVAGGRPSTGGELTVLLQALIPLVFSYSISRYRLVDIEVFLKKAATLIFSFFVIASLYFFVGSRTRIFSENRLNAIVLGALAIVLGATLFTPLKRLFQGLLDRAIYKRSYEYRRTLLSITRDLGRERDLGRLAPSLLEAIANALSLRTLALLLADEKDPRSFSVLRALGEARPLPARLALDGWLVAQVRDRDTLSFVSASESEPARAAMENLAALGFFHVLPLRVEDKIIGALVMGKKADGSFFSREDWELLSTISGPAALALENADLYGREIVRAMEMQRLKDYSENIIESLTVGVSVIDEAGLVIGWNRVLEDQLGVRKEAALGRKLGDVLGAATFGALFPQEGQPDFRLLSEISLETAAGGKKIFDIARTPLLDNALQAYGTIIVFEDVTDKIRLQQQLLTSEKLASIGLLSAGVAHEINTPLTGISSYIQMLQKKLTDSHYAQILGKVEAQTDRVARIIKNLLAFARSPSDASFTRVDLKSNLEEILSLIDYKLRNMNIRLDLELAPVPPLYAQGERLQQVFINIILNALDAMPAGGTLGIRLGREDGAAVVRISDTGTGIKPEHLSRIFDPFFTTKGVGKGTGLGLSISYAIIKEHDGRIDVRSEVGRGTTFTITLPIGRDGSRGAPPAAPGT